MIDEKKKILLVGFFSMESEVFTYASSFLKILSNLNHQVTVFDYRRTPQLFIDFLLRQKCKTFRPDMIFFIKAEKVSWKTIKYLKQNSDALLVNFYPDNPFTFWNGNSNSNVLNSFPFFDYFLIWARQLIPIILAAGAREVIYFPFAFENDKFTKHIDLSDTDIARYSSDVCFVGSWDKDRQNWLEKLSEKFPNLNLAIWGNRWHENLSQSSNLKKFIKGGAIYNDEMIKAFRASKIVLNFIRKQNLDAHNMRTIEVPACNAFMLTQYTNEQAKYLFKECHSIECFKTLDELVIKIKLFLNDDQLRSTRTKNSFIAVQKYSLNKQILNFFKKINFYTVDKIHEC